MTTWYVTGGPGHDVHIAAAVTETTITTRCGWRWDARNPGPWNPRVAEDGFGTGDLNPDVLIGGSRPFPQQVCSLCAPRPRRR